MRLLEGVPAPVPAPHKPSRWLGAGAALTSLAAVGYAAHRGGRAADEQTARMQDMNNAREHNLAAPMPSMTVKQSSDGRHDDFARRKLAAQGGVVAGPPMFYPTARSQAEGAMANALVDFGVRKPLDELGSIMKKKLYTEPKRRRVFNYVMAQDPELKAEMEKNPHIIGDSYRSLKEFAPTLTEDPNAVRSFLHQARATGGNIDYATFNMLADIEKKVRNARGQGVGQ